MRTALNAAAFSGRPVSERQAKAGIAQANSLIAQAHLLSTSSSTPVGQGVR